MLHLPVDSVICQARTLLLRSIPCVDFFGDLVTAVCLPAGNIVVEIVNRLHAADDVGYELLRKR